MLTNEELATLRDCSDFGQMELLMVMYRIINAIHDEDNSADFSSVIVDTSNEMSVLASRSYRRNENRDCDETAGLEPKPGYVQVNSEIPGLTVLLSNTLPFGTRTIDSVSTGSIQDLTAEFVIRRTSNEDNRTKQAPNAAAQW